LFPFPDQSEDRLSGIMLRLELTDIARVKLPAAGTTAVSLPLKVPAEVG
jgi:hypothetical protein